MNPRPHDLLRLSPTVADVLPADAPGWARDALRRSPWVVVRRAVAPAGKVAVGCRGTERSQRYGWFIHADDVLETVTPEALAATDPAACREDLPAMRALGDTRATLFAAGFAWGPAGSVGFELATGNPTATVESDLDLVVRADELDVATVDRLGALLHRLVDVGARIDCHVETRTGAVALAELAGSSRDVLVKTPSGPRLVERAAALT